MSKTSKSKEKAQPEKNMLDTLPQDIPDDVDIRLLPGQCDFKVRLQVERQANGLHVGYRILHTDRCISRGEFRAAHIAQVLRLL